MLRNKTKRLRHYETNLKFYIFSELSQTFTKDTKQNQAFHLFNSLSQTFTIVTKQIHAFHIFSDLSQKFKTLENQSKRLKLYEINSNVSHF